MKIEQLWALIKGRPWKCLGFGEDPKTLRMSCDTERNEQITFSALRHLKENVIYAVIYSFRSGRSLSELTDSISASCGVQGSHPTQQQSQATEAALGDNRFVRSLSAWQLSETSFLVLASGDREFDPTRQASLAGNRAWLSDVFDCNTFVENEKSWQSRQIQTNPPPR